MVENLGEWPSKRVQISKIRPSYDRKGTAVPLVVDRWYDFHEFGCHLGNVGLELSHGTRFDGKGPQAGSRENGVEAAELPARQGEQLAGVQSTGKPKEEKSI
jgi:hypothetical protein